MTKVEYNHMLSDVSSVHDIGPYYINGPNHIMKTVVESIGPTTSSVQHVAYTQIQPLSPRRSAEEQGLTRSTLTALECRRAAVSRTTSASVNLVT